MTKEMRKENKNVLGLSQGYDSECVVIRYPDGKKQRLGSDITGWRLRHGDPEVIIFTNENDECLGVMKLMSGMLITREKYLL